MKTGDTIPAGTKVQIKKLGTLGWVDYTTQKDVKTGEVREIMFKVRRGPNGVKLFWVTVYENYEIRVAKS